MATPYGETGRAGWLLVGRVDVLFAVDGAAGGGEDDLPQLSAAAGFQKIQKADDIDVGVEDRVLHRTPDIHLGGMVNQDLDLALDQTTRPASGDLTS